MTRTIIGCAVCVAGVLAAGAGHAIPPVPAPYLGAQASVRIGSFFEMDPPAGQTFVGVLHAHAGCCNGGPAAVTGLADATDDWGTIRDVVAVSADNYQSPIPTAASVLASTASADNLTVSAGSRLVLSFHVTGTYSYALAEFELAVNGGNRAITGVECDPKAGVCAATFTFMVPFTPGTPFGLMINSGLSYQGIGVIGSPESPTSFAWVSDFSHTVQLVSAEVEDDAGSPVEATIESNSGFDYAHPLGGGTSTTTTTTATIPTTTATTFDDDPRPFRLRRRTGSDVRIDRLPARRVARPGDRRIRSRRVPGQARPEPVEGERWRGGWRRRVCGVGPEARARAPRASDPGHDPVRAQPPDAPRAEEAPGNAAC